MFDRKDFTFAKKSSVLSLKVLIISEKHRKLQLWRFSRGIKSILSMFLTDSY